MPRTKRISFRCLANKKCVFRCVKLPFVSAVCRKTSRSCGSAGCHIQRGFVGLLEIRMPDVRFRLEPVRCVGTLAMTRSGMGNDMSVALSLVFCTVAVYRGALMGFS